MVRERPFDFYGCLCVCVWAGGGGAGRFFNKKNPGPDFAGEKKSRIGVNTKVCFVKEANKKTGSRRGRKKFQA